MSRRERKRVAGLLIFFKDYGRGPKPRSHILGKITDEEILEVIRLVSGRTDVVHDILSYVNTHKTSSREVTLEDLAELRRLLAVSEVMDS